MIQKFLIARDQENSIVTIKEFAILDGMTKNIDLENLKEDPFSFVCKAEYDSKEIEAALSKGKQAIISSIRTRNMYPIGDYAEAIADSISDLFESGSSDSVEVLFNDIELMSAGLDGDTT